MMNDSCRMAFDDICVRYIAILVEVRGGEQCVLAKLCNKTLKITVKINFQLYFRRQHKCRFSLFFILSRLFHSSVRKSIITIKTNFVVKGVFPF